MYCRKIPEMDMITSDECVALYRELTGRDIEPGTWRSYSYREQVPPSRNHFGRTPLWDRAEVVAFLRKDPGSQADDEKAVPMGAIQSTSHIAPYALEMRSESFRLGSWHRHTVPGPAVVDPRTLAVPDEDTAVFTRALKRAQRWATKNAAPVTPSAADPWTVDHKGTGLWITGPFIDLRVNVIAPQRRQRIGRVQLNAEIEYRHLGHLVDRITA
jgi:hypothetical protein